MGLGRTLEDSIDSTTKFSSARFFVRPKRLVRVLKPFSSPVVHPASLQRLDCNEAFAELSWNHEIFSPHR